MAGLLQRRGSEGEESESGWDRRCGGNLFYFVRRK